MTPEASRPFLLLTHALGDRVEELFASLTTLLGPGVRDIAPPSASLSLSYPLSRDASCIPAPLACYDSFTTS
jgi:hypothetical protein